MLPCLIATFRSTCSAIVSHLSSRRRSRRHATANRDLKAKLRKLSRADGDSDQCFDCEIEIIVTEGESDDGDERDGPVVYESRQ